MGEMVFAPMSFNSRTRRLQAKKRTMAIGSGEKDSIHKRRHRQTITQAKYKKDWLGHQNTLGENVVRVEWRGWLFEDEIGKEVPMGWCQKGEHYIAWKLRHGHLEECMWRKGKLYGK